MKQFEIPEFYRSPIISQVKAKRKLNDPRKKDFTPSILDFGKVKFILARHFGFCYGVENAIEISYRAIQENPGKRIFLLSQMIHNPEVNEDLLSHGLQFIQDTKGNQLIDWSELTSDDIVIIPAFGTTLEIEEILEKIGVNVQQYNTTCPFVEKVWNRSEKLGQDGHTIIIHGKYNHEETRATFSHSDKNAPSLIVKDMSEAQFLGDYIAGYGNTLEFLDFFKGKHSVNFDPEKDLLKIGVVNQTTMLATETQEITDYLRNVMLNKYGEENIREHIADTRDTLCYATNDNQSATYGLLETNADFAIVIGGHNSSNTTHLVELLEEKFPTYFIRSERDMEAGGALSSFNIHTHSIEKHTPMDNLKLPATIIVTSGASCPDAVVDRVLKKILDHFQVEIDINEVISSL
ncbi:MAG: 4-hydroxy-3-methylbut-2-enyl diphosphate reductase [Cryomorphaceae bacterium]|jgi:4-hydroxy-3-methylbut-2-enyl diphosphate reductase|nr:4-hydroxy-3-methylbut-2-enyl diphosphate reductase [Cryomorphaceae bacterium]